MADVLRLLWAKTNKANDWHPLIFHLLDSGFVSLSIWEDYLSPFTRERFSHLLGVPQQDAGRLLAYWTALHDLGKASPGFQAKFPLQKSVLQTTGLLFPPNLSPRPHNLVSAWALETLLPNGLKPLTRVLIAHHGELAPAHSVLDPTRHEQLGSAHWADLRKQLFDCLREAFQPPDYSHLPPPGSNRNALLLLSLGLLVVSDWIASAEKNFPYTSPEQTISDYIGRSQIQASQAVRKLGFRGWQASGDIADFSALFTGAGISDPNPIQAALLDAASDLHPPALVILEAPTGSGKTEAALCLADRWLQESRGRGLYIALPTTATSNQMFDRVVDFLQRRYPDTLVNLQLVHGHALLDDQYLAMQLGEIGEDDDARVAAMSWFATGKKALLAPFGVGTVDQSFLAVLQTRFFFLRLFGLEGKVVIFDEVHAYDTYMSVLFDRLLGWLHAVGASVIILSATLPEATRQRLVHAYSGLPADPKGEATHFPRATLHSGSSVKVYPLPISPGISREVSLDWLADDPDALVTYLQEKLSGGGCAAVICNTVARAQEVYRRLKAAHIIPDEESFLFHARFPYSWRKATEEAVLARFSRQGARPQRGLVVATQVIEQSLDLDFDLMFTDLAPVDLIIQRAGRLHRHPGRLRPPDLSQPILVILRPAVDTERLSFGSSEYVYEPYHLDTTWLALRGCDRLCLPDETGALIEQVYGDQPLPGVSQAERTRLAEEHRMVEQSDDQQEFNAQNWLIATPQDEDLLLNGTVGHDEDDAGLNGAYRAYTRADAPGISVICLHRLADGTLVTDPQDSSTQVPALDEAVTANNIGALLRAALQVNRRDLVPYLAHHPVPQAWRKTAALRHHRLLIFENGICHVDGCPYVFDLSHDFGLETRKETG